MQNYRSSLIKLHCCDQILFVYIITSGNAKNCGSFLNIHSLIGGVV